LPSAKFFGYNNRDGMYTTLLMSTGLTFGSISALYGLTNNYITNAQYSAIVAVVILSAILPTMVAQRFFLPSLEQKRATSRQNVKAIPLTSSLEN